MPTGPTSTMFTHSPPGRRRRAKLVWVGAQHAIGRPPYSMLMVPARKGRTTRWIIQSEKEDPTPIIIDAPAKLAYEILIERVSA